MRIYINSCICLFVATISSTSLAEPEQPSSPPTTASSEAAPVDDPSLSSAPSEDDAKADEAKADEAKADEAKADEAKADEAKADEAEANEAEANEAEANEAEADDVDSSTTEATVENTAEDTVADDESIPEAAVEPADNGERTAPRQDVETFVITTERREQDLQDVAAVAKVASGEELQAIGTNSFTDLSNSFPQLNIANREGNVEVFIRGIGDDNNTEKSEPRSAMLLDGIYISRPRGLGSFFFDLERVELNIGPQGTLRGRNATGGSLNIVSARPKLGEYEGYINLGYGNFNQREIQGAINVPIGYDLAFRVATNYLKNDAKIENAGPLDIEESRATEDLAVRASVRWEPSDSFQFTAVADFMDSKGTGYSGQDFFPLYQMQYQKGTPRLSVSTPIQDLDNPWQNLTQGSQPWQKQTIWGVRGEAVLDLGYVNVQVLSAFRSTDFLSNTPGRDAYFPGIEEFHGIDLSQQALNDDTEQFFESFGRTQFDQVFESIVEELRLYSDQDQRFRWTTGAFYFRETGHSFYNTSSDRGNAGWTYLGGEYAFPDIERQSIAFYGDATLDITSKLRVTGGIRYTSEELSRYGFGGNHQIITTAAGYQTRFGGRGLEFMGRDRTVRLEDVDISTPEGQAKLFRSGIRRFGTTDNIDETIDLLLSMNEDSAFISQISPNNASRSDDFVNWRLRLEYDVLDDVLVYAGASTGTNSGGFNDAVQANESFIAKEFDAEHVLVVEVGSKNRFRLFGYQGTLNVAAFWYSYQDQQFTVLAPTTEGDVIDQEEGEEGGLTTLQQNVGNSEILGFDFDYTQNLPGYIRLRANVQVLQAKFTDADTLLVDTRFNYPSGPENTIPFDPTDNKLPKASDLSGSLTLSKLFITDVGSFEANVSMGFRTEYFLSIFNGDGTLPEITAENFPDATEQQLADLQRSVNSGAGSSYDKVDGYVRFDAGFAYTTPSEKLRLELYGKNLTNIAYSQTALISPNLNLRFLNDPLSFGGRIRVSF